MNIGKYPFDFKLIEENLNQINFTEKSPLRDYSTYRDFLNQAIVVKDRSVFENVKIPDYENFIPFQYQIDSIKTMLEKFEGKGVFGDQVGLGKTIQALITADMMFRLGRIQNAVIVAPKTLILQWKGEIKAKFPGVFNILSREDVNVDTMENLVLLDDPKLVSKDHLNIVFIDSDQFQNEKQAKGDDQLEKDIAKCERRIDQANQEIARLKKEYQSLLVKHQSRLRFEGLLGKTSEEAEASIPAIAEVLAKIEIEKKTISAQTVTISSLKKAKTYAKQIDLLIIDEAHKVIDSINGSRHKDIFVNFGKTYCILLSATPIEKSIDDVYDLVGFVAGNRFQNINQFYNYVEAKSLSELAHNKKSMERLNGLINSLFTRKRLRDKSVIRALTPDERHPLKLLADFIEGKIENTPESLGMSEAEKRAIREKIDHEIYLLTEPIRKLYLNGSEAKIPLSNYFQNHMESLLNAFLISFYLKSNDRFVYPFITWAPAARTPYFYEVMTPFEVNRTILDSDLINEGSSRFTRMLIYQMNMKARFALFDGISEKEPMRKILMDLSIPQTANMMSRPYFVNEFTALIRKMHLSDADEMYLASAARKYWNGGRNYDVLEFNRLYRDTMLRLFHEDENENAVFLIDFLRLTGADLHAASNFILCQTNIKSRGSEDTHSIDPLELEQYIGRIYRIGQSFDVTIHVFPSNRLEDFLFREIYNDPKGLDLFGEEKIETGFVVPIIVEAMKQKISSYSMPKNPGFMDIFSYCFTHTERPYMAQFKKTIYEVCENFKIKSLEEDE